MKFRMILTALAVALCSASSAFAGKFIATAPALRSFPTPQTLYCDATNLDTVARTMTIEALDGSGAVVDGPYVTTLAPSTGDYMYAYSLNASWCRFTLTGAGSIKKIRGIALYDNGSTYDMILPAE